ncbi:STAS/SEC14 domain-containing protein [Rhodanobacter panaciterrae]|uniref:STAS/SEC14 domain-containing protein n=1 Tax=Rhodanobacter panaciterrae TaxID=490572 RepID=A0ABQ2ZNR2_9GAMM|nr:STAS/SEC14 domain-containing protein [Rhodanobacter panaciterrae]GGY20972.1 STAS/SEC14 domain-containing protein [Rhodanobacter panaciterrae]
MIAQIEGLPAGTLGFRAHGQVTAADYENIIVPDVEAAFALNRKLRLLYVTAEDFTGFDPGAMWDDAKLGMRHFSSWERIALVTDVGWLRTAATAFSFAVPAQVRLFHGAELTEATHWIAEKQTA